MFLVTLEACGGAQRGSGSAGPPLDPIVLQRVEGGALDLSELRGRVVVLFFFTTYSGPAQALAPFVSQVAVRHAGDDLSVVGVALEPGELAIVEAWRDFVGVTFPVLLADEAMMTGDSPLGRIPAVPSFAFLDRQGALVGWDIRLLRETQLEQIVRDLLE